MDTVLYRDFQIIYWPPPIPIRRWDWHFAHLEFCGDGDNRHGDAGSLEEAKQEIDRWHDEGDW